MKCRCFYKQYEFYLSSLYIYQDTTNPIFFISKNNPFTGAPKSQLIPSNYEDDLQADGTRIPFATLSSSIHKQHRSLPTVLMTVTFCRLTDIDDHYKRQNSAIRRWAKTHWLSRDVNILSLGAQKVAYLVYVMWDRITENSKNVSLSRYLVFVIRGCPINLRILVCIITGVSIYYYDQFRKFLVILVRLLDLSFVLLREVHLVC